MSVNSLSDKIVARAHSKDESELDKTFNGIRSKVPMHCSPVELNRNGEKFEIEFESALCQLKCHLIKARKDNVAELAIKEFMAKFEEMKSVIDDFED